MVYVAIGIGGLAVVLMGAILMVMLSGRGGEPVPKAGGGPEKVVQVEAVPASPNARAIEPIGGPGSDASGVSPAPVPENTESAPATAPVIDEVELSAV